MLRGSSEGYQVPERPRPWNWLEYWDASLVECSNAEENLAAMLVSADAASTRAASPPYSFESLHVLFTKL
eukprot:6171243-Prymnesium_polylepis.1